MNAPLSIWKGDSLVPAPPLTSLQALLLEVSLELGVPEARILSQSRERKVAHARQEFMWRAYQIRYSDGSRRFSMPRIGAFFDGKGGRDKPIDHTTVLHAVRSVEKRNGVLTA